MGEPHHGEGFFRGDAPVSAIADVEVEVLPGSQAWIKRGIFDEGSEFLGARWMPIDEDASLAGRETDHGLQQRCLACAVGAEQSVYLAVVEIVIQVVEKALSFNGEAYLAKLYQQNSSLSQMPVGARVSMPWRTPALFGYL
jgi:hypothetical protein